MINNIYNKQFFVSKFWLYSIGLSLLVAFISVLKPIDMLPDGDVYKYYFDSISNGEVVDVESSFIYISLLGDYFGGGIYFVFFTYAIISLYIKLKVFGYFKRRYAIVILYLSSYLVLHELIQIRIALSISLMFLSYLFFLQCRHYMMFLCFCLATFFHITSFVFVLIFIASIQIVKNDKMIKLLYFILFFAFLVAENGVMNINELMFYLPSFFKSKYELYIKMQAESSETFNLFSFRLSLFYFVLLLYYPKIKIIEMQDKILLVIFMIFLIFVFSMTHLPVISFRLLEMISPFMIILIVDLHEYYKNKYLKLIPILFVFSSLYYSVTLFQMHWK